MEKNETVHLKTSNHVSVTTLVDNYTDLFLQDGPHVERAKLTKDGARTGPLLAEHGLSFLIEAEDQSEKHAIIMDFGLTNIVMPHNIGVLDIDLEAIEAAFLSHGHHDHIGAAREVLKAISRPVDLLVHADAFLEERIHKFPNGKEAPIPSLKEEKVKFPHVSIVKVSKPTLIADGYAATLTNIPRQTDFETGMPTTYYKKGGEVYKDHINDDQGLVLNIEGKGLFILSGCGHSGIINTILHAREITGVKDVFAVMGGFHLTGPHFEKIIDPTIQEMKKFAPKVIVPCHCTGWTAISAFKEAFPESFVLNSVGTKIIV